MATASIDEHANEHAEEQYARSRSVDGEGRPSGEEMGGRGEGHGAILADGDAKKEFATVVDPLLESGTDMYLADVKLNPSTSALPGSAALQQLANGIAAWALVGALIALLLGAGMWAVGSHTQNAHQSSQGRRAVVTSLAAAVLIGAAPTLINFFFKTGLSVH